MQLIFFVTWAAKIALEKIKILELSVKNVAKSVTKRIKDVAGNEFKIIFHL